MTEVGDNRMRNQRPFAEDSHESLRATRPEDRPGNRPEGERSLSVAALWDVDDVSRYLRIPTSAVYKMTQRVTAVRIPHIRIGGRLRFRQHDIEQWLSLLTTSNLQTLEGIRKKALKVTHGNHP